MVKIKRVKPEEVEKAIVQALAEYGNEASEKLEGMLKTASRETSRELKASEPTGGEYAKGWSHKNVGSGAYKLTRVVYNRKCQIIHLLERPHTTGRYKGGHYPKKVDYTGTVERVEKQKTEEFYQEVVANL